MRPAPLPLSTRLGMIQITAAGRVFLDHARLALLQVETACEVARRAAQPEKTSFVLGFLTGHEAAASPASSA